MMNTKSKKKVDTKKKTELSKKKKKKSKLKFLKKNIDTNGEIVTSRLNITSNFR